MSSVLSGWPKLDVMWLRSARLLEEADPGTGRRALCARYRAGACGGCSQYQKPRFVLSPSDPGAATALREKIKSKMDTAKVLGAFLTGLLAVAADALLTRVQPSNASLWLAAIGLTMLALAIVLYFVTLFLYDALLMPARFWSSRAPKTRIADDRRRRRILRPPGPDVWVLYEGMLRVWTRAFVPATFFAGAGVALLTLALADPPAGGAGYSVAWPSQRPAPYVTIWRNHNWESTTDPPGDWSDEALIPTRSVHPISKRRCRPSYRRLRSGVLVSPARGVLEVNIARNALENPCPVAQPQ